LYIAAGIGYGWRDRGDPDAERLHRLQGQGGDERVRDEGRSPGVNLNLKSWIILLLSIIIICVVKLVQLFGTKLLLNFRSSISVTHVMVENRTTLKVTKISQVIFLKVKLMKHFLYVFNFLFIGKKLL
jgi:hypothetical protein